VTLDYHDVNDGRAVVIDPLGRMPHFVVKVDGRWLVDPGALVLAAKTARAIRLRRESGTGPVREAYE
jgi:hypothetical protein